jgi:5-methylcytosine-specific restriction endonuclease McrA
MAIGVMTWVWDYSRSRHGARLVLLAIADRGEVATITVAELSCKTRLAERAVQSAIRELVALGELAVEYNISGASRYRVLMSHMDPRPIPPSTVREPIPVELRFFVFERDNYRCVQCESTEDLTIDHIYPRIRGGADTEDNLQTLCRSCNCRKGARVLWRAQKSRSGIRGPWIRRRKSRPPGTDPR